MNWQLTVQDALFFILIPLFGVIGFQWGWRRAFILLLSILLGIGFLYLNGGIFLARLVYQFFTNQNLSDQALTSSHFKVVLVSTFLALAVIIGLGYALGKRAPTPGANLLGLVFGLITGALVALYLGGLLSGTEKTVITQGSVNLNLSVLLANSVVVLGFLLLVVLVIGLLVRPKKGGSGGGGKPH